MKKTPFVCTLFFLFSLASTGWAQSGSDASLKSIRAYLKISDTLGTGGQPTDEQFQAIKDAGYDLVINLAPPVDMHDREGFLVTSTGMSYVQIPVDFRNPSLDHLEFFFRTMEANKDRKIFVHCFANMRVSSFVYLYRLIHDGVSEEEAHRALNEIWEPEGAWPAFIARAREHYGDER